MTHIPDPTPDPAVDRALVASAFARELAYLQALTDTEFALCNPAVRPPVGCMLILATPGDVPSTASETA